MDGVLPLYKPIGMTSHDCVFKIRKLLKTKKVGHTGTLDPDVDGVLPICIGNATKIVQFLTDQNKAYTGEVTLGTATSTEDASGEIIESKAIEESIARKDVVRIVKNFEGEITQIPPMYSAVKVKGKRLYEYAREGIQVERPQRKVTIHKINLLNEWSTLNAANPSFQFEVLCSKGTYIRTLAVDIGKQLGYPAHMSQLTRTKSGAISLNDTYTFEQIECLIEENKLKLISIEEALDDFKKVNVNHELEQRIKNGAVLELPKNLENENRFLMMNTVGKCIAIYQPHPEKAGLMKPEKVFN